MCKRASEEEIILEIMQFRDNARMQPFKRPNIFVPKRVIAPTSPCLVEDASTREQAAKFRPFSDNDFNSSSLVPLALAWLPRSFPSYPTKQRCSKLALSFDNCPAQRNPHFRCSFTNLTPLDPPHKSKHRLTYNGREYPV
jgi:hypothetical protein